MSMTQNYGYSATMSQIEFGFSVWQTFPSHLVGYFGYTHAWDDIRQQWAHSSQPHNHVSIIDTEILFYHRYIMY